MNQGATAARRVYADGAAFVDGRFVPVAEARVPILDWGFLRSDATYDVAHVWRGSFFRLEDHLDRFERGMERLRLRPPYDRAEIREILTECVRLSGLRDAYAEVICTRGIPPPGSRDPRECANNFFAFAVPFVWIADPDKQERGLHAVIGPVQRIQPGSVDPKVKNYHWLDLEVGLYEAYDRDGETVILVDGKENVVEGPGFNVFTVKGGRIATPSQGVLEGITRKTVIELADELGVPPRSSGSPCRRGAGGGRSIRYQHGGRSHPGHDGRREGGGDGPTRSRDPALARRVLGHAPVSPILAPCSVRLAGLFHLATR
jgi:branched-chain amino acid aminotransferase